MKLTSMIKIGCVASMLFGSAIGVAATSDWMDLKGCYSTVTFNDQPGSNKLEYRGTANNSENFGWATMPGVDHIGSFEFTLFNYHQGNTTYMGQAWVFPEYGKTERSADGKTRTWSYSGPMICTGLCASPTPFTMNTKVEVKDLGNDLLQIHNWRQIPELQDQSMNADDVYVVKREHQDCTMCEKNPDGSYTCGPHP